MKKLFLLLAGSIVAFGANAQYAKHSVVDAQNNTRKVPLARVPTTQQTAVNHHSGARTTSIAPFYTQDFSSGAATGLPTGWSTGVNPGGSGAWHWEVSASSAPYTDGVLNSTSAANGWMIFDADSVGGPGNTGITPSAWLQSADLGPSGCATATSVSLTFEDYFRKLQDSCFVWVSTSPTFTTHTSYPVGLNNALSNQSNTLNADTVRINISAAAAGQAHVYIRFVYMGQPGGSYSWMIDDMAMTRDSVDVELHSGAVVYNAGSDVGPASYSIIPSSFADTLTPAVFANNYGAVTENLTVNAKIGTAYNHNASVLLPSNAFDSLADYSGFPGYFTNTAGIYNVDFSTVVVADSLPNRLLDTATFIVSDTIWSENPVTPAGGSFTDGSYFYVYAPSVPEAFSPGTLFNVAPGQSDTLTSVSVAFAIGSGQKVGVQIYHFVPSGTSGTWQYDGLTTFKTLAAGDISTSSLVFVDFPVDVAGSGNKIILSGGTTGVAYCAVVKGNANTATVGVFSTDNPADNSLVGYVGLDDTSNNNGGATQDFGATLMDQGLGSTPMIRMNFGHYPVGVKNVNANVSRISAYPNPATDQLNIAFSLINSSDVTVTLTNLLGQTVATQKMSNVSNGKAVFNTAGFAAGTYIYTFECNGARSTGHVVVAH